MLPSESYADLREEAPCVELLTDGLDPESPPGSGQWNQH